MVKNEIIYIILKIKNIYKKIEKNIFLYFELSETLIEMFGKPNEWQLNLTNFSLNPKKIISIHFKIF